MDFCLKGSQINLARRQQPKPKYSHINALPVNIRPHSATLFFRRSHSSPFLRRPQSADPKFGRTSRCDSVCGAYCNDKNYSSNLKNNKNKPKCIHSLSSSNLLKLLLEEPIKRSWLLDNPATRTPSIDCQSELSTPRRNSSLYNFDRKYLRTTSVDSSSVESENSDKHTKSLPIDIHLKTKQSSALVINKTMHSFTREKSTLNTTSRYSQQHNADYWLPTSNTTQLSTTATIINKSTKPDLPGRVSFSKPSLQKDVDSSDCDNDKAYLKYSTELTTTSNTHRDTIDESISAPGPMKYNFSAEHLNVIDFRSKERPTSAGLKKSVHFGGANGDEEVLAETYEYPKCPSENCSCSTRSSSTTSTQDGFENAKCACDSPTCKYAVNDNRASNYLKLDLETNQSLSVTETNNTNSFAGIKNLEESEVIREYKSTIAQTLGNPTTRNLTEDSKSKLSSFSNLNNMETSTFLSKYAAPAKADILLEKQNNLSESRNGSAYNSLAGSKRNLMVGADKEPSKSHNNNNTNLENLKSKVAYTSTSDSVINNYLKVTASVPVITKKKENNKSESSDSKSVGASAKKKKSSVPGILKPKSVSANTDRSKLQKATSFNSLSEDKNLNEFNLDKVDTWMSMHESTLPKKTTKHSSLEVGIDKLNDVSSEQGNDEDELDDDSNSNISIKSDGNSQDDSTYNEIVSVIKEIDEEKKKDNYAERSIVDMELKIDTPTEMGDTPHSTNELREARETPDKYKDILNYLDNVEDSCDKTLMETRRSMPESNRSEVEFIVEPDIVEDVPKLSDLLMLPNHQLARRVVALSLRANELANAVYLSKENVAKLRDEKQKSLRVEKANATNRLTDQKKHYESIIQRHQTFIEQLLKDKGSLCEKIAALTRRLESQNQAWEHKLETETTRVKETTLAGEKIRRERWVRENTKKIKELTVKGLEAEINKMTCEHQREVTELKRFHQQQLLDSLEEARIKHEQIENSIRETCAQDRESIIEKERTAIRERFDRQMEEERKSFDEQKQKLLDDLSAQREIHKNELKAKEKDYQKKLLDAQRESHNELEQNVLELQGKMSKQDEKYQNRINTIEKQYEADFEIWKRDYESSCKLEQVEKENAVRQHYRAERDRQIDAIVVRMDAEALKNAEEFDVKINRLKEKYERDIHEIESVEKSLREKYTDTRTRLAESDAQVRNFQAEIKQLQIELGHSKKMCDEFLNERDQMRDNLRNELQSEVTSLKSERDGEIQKIHKRVQQAIEKKDVTIDILQKENGCLRERCLKLEAVIRQQRKDYCVK